jgi:hypothetical protein
MALHETEAGHKIWKFRRISGMSLLEFPIDNTIPVWFFNSHNIRSGSTFKEEGGKMKKTPGAAALLPVLMTAVCLLLAGCAGKGYTPGTAPDSFPCVPESKLEKDIVPEAALEKLSCSFKTYEGKDTLHLTVAVKNVSDKPQRYRVNLFMDNGKAVGGLIPRTTKEGLVEPGQSKSFDYPVVDMPQSPKAMTLIIKTASP